MKTLEKVVTGEKFKNYENISKHLQRRLIIGIFIFRDCNCTEYNLTRQVTRYRSKKLCGVAILLRVPLNTLVYDIL